MLFHCSFRTGCIGLSVCFSLLRQHEDGREENLKGTVAGCDN